MVGKLLATLAAVTLAAAPVAAQPTPSPEPPVEQSQGNGVGSGDVAYLVLPFLVLIALLVAITKEDEGPASP